MSVAAQVDSQREEYGSGVAPGFKAGDRVRRVTVSNWPEDYGELGREYLVLSVGRSGNPVVIKGKPAADRNAFVLVGAPLRIEAGKFYRTRDGRKVGPMEDHDYTAHDTDEALVGCTINDDPRLWRKGTGSHLFKESDIDLIAEWVDEPAAAASNDNEATAKFKVGDRMRATESSAYSVKKGHIYTVTEDIGDGDIRFQKRDGTIDGWGAKFFELVEEPQPADLAITISLNADNLHQELDEIIAKLKKIKKLKRQIAA